MTNEFMRQYRHIKKKNPQAGFEEIKPELREVLDRSLPPFPEAMVEEAWLYFLQPLTEPDELEKAADFVDFCNSNLEVDQSVLEENDWLFIRDLVNMFAMELDLDFVSEVMTVMVDKGWISKT